MPTSEKSREELPNGAKKQSKIGSSLDKPTGAVLNRAGIHRLLRTPTRSQDGDSLVITPLIYGKSGDPIGMEEDAVDLRLGMNFLAARADRLAVNVPGVTSGLAFQAPVHVPLGSYFVLPGHHVVLASTLEYIKLPKNLSGMVLTKSSWARNFILIETAPWIHPEYRGCLTLEIANVSEVPQLLYPGYRVAQLIFFHVDQAGAGDPLHKPSYHGPIKPEPPAIKPPKERLANELGVDPESIFYPQF